MGGCETSWKHEARPDYDSLNMRPQEHSVNGQNEIYFEQERALQPEVGDASK